ncbi:MAG: GDP-mannose 4,6-dehydratase [bacterium]
MSQQINILVTGAAGFIGWKVCEFLLNKPELIPSSISSPLKGDGQGEGATINVVGIDNMNDYYDVRLKQWRLDQLKKYPNFKFHKLDIENYDSLKKLFQQYSTRKNPSSLTGDAPTHIPSPFKGEGKGEGVTNSPHHSISSAPFLSVINLAARAGVRYSMENPFVYYTTNIIGNLNLLELCREFGVNKFILASTSSLYAGQKMPFKEDLPVNEPISPYAASKKSAEMTCYTYHHLYGIDVTILRYFTVYGPASRPDMSPLRFISWVYQEKPVIIYGDGTQSRDFTYVDDIARGTIMALKPLGFEIINLGCDKPYKLLDFLGMIEEKLGKKAKITHEPIHPADMQATWADIIKAKAVLKWQPNTNLEQGIKRSIQWFNENKTLAERIEL